MTSSSDPHTEPWGRPLRFVDAARLHARRFDKHPVASALRLLSADQRIVHPEGGIALLTEAGHAIRATALFVSNFVPAFAIMLGGVAFDSVVVAVIGALAAATAALVLAPRCERQIRAHHTYGSSLRTWVLSDVATEPHRGIGDELVREVTRRADQALATVVLEVADANEVAKRLYIKHGFEVGGQHGHRLIMRRVAGSR